jgi:hypothetical protein
VALNVPDPANLDPTMLSRVATALADRIISA